MTEENGALQELHREHEVAEHLLERLVTIGEQMRSGTEFPPKTVRLGVGLLESYLHRVHASQLDRELRPEAERVAMPMCFEHLDHMTANHAEMRHRAQALLDLIHRWAAGDDSCRAAVADSLIELASLDYDAATYEETYPLICLETALPEEVGRRLADRFAGHSGTRGALESNVAKFLAATAE